MTAISLAEWGQYLDTGATTYAVGQVPAVAAVYLDRARPRPRGPARRQVHRVDRPHRPSARTAEARRTPTRT